MGFLFFILFIGGLGFVGYAIITYYQATPMDQGVGKRIWASLGAAAVAIGTAVTAWFHSGVSP